MRSLRPLGKNLLFLHQSVLGEMPRMTFRGITSPVDNEICSILDFAERTSDLTTQLGSYFSWTVSQGGMAVEQRTKQVCHGDTFLCASQVVLLIPYTSGMSASYK